MAAVSFEAGYLRAGNAKSSPIVIEKASQSLKNETQGVLGCEASKTAPSSLEGLKTPIEAVLSKPANCAYVGSKSSNKYYPPTCQWAKRIKPENVVCFNSEDEAKGQGREAGKGCK